MAQWEFRVRLLSRIKCGSSFGKSRSNDRWKQATSWGYGRWWFWFDFLGSWIRGRAVACDADPTLSWDCRQGPWSAHCWFGAWRHELSGMEPNEVCVWKVCQLWQNIPRCVCRWWDGRILQMEHGSPWKQGHRANCKGLALFPLRMQSCGGLWKGWKAKGLLRRDFGAETAGWLKMSLCSSRQVRQHCSFSVLRKSRKDLSYECKDEVNDRYHYELVVHWENSESATSPPNQSPRISDHESATT